MDLRARLALLFLAAGLLLGLSNVLLYRSNDRLVEDMRWVMHSHLVRKEIGAVELAAHDMSASMRDLVLTRRENAVNEYVDARERMHVSVERVKQLVADHRAQGDNVQKLIALAATRRETMDRLLHTQQRDPAAALSLINQGSDREGIADFTALIQAMHEIEGNLLGERESATRASVARTQLLLVVAAVTAIALLGLCLILVWREQRRRQITEASLREAAIALEAALTESRGLSSALRQLGEMAEMLQSCQSISEAYAVARATLPALLGGSAGTVQTINASQNLVETALEWGEPAIARETLFAPEACLAIRRGQPYPPAGAQVVLHCQHLHDSAAASPAQYLCVPLSAQGAAFGILHVSCAGPIDASLRRDCIAAAEQLSLSLANLRLQDSLRTQSIRDPLTGLFNRRYLEASLPRELQRAERRQSDLSVLMLDIDHFKRFNDTQGHDAGDALLAQVGVVLAQVARSEDIVCRYGGEEFTLVLLDTDLDQALGRAEQVRRAIAAIDVSHRRVHLGRVTCSIGLASYPPHGNTPADLIARADRALYLAKESGRDRVEAARAVV
ncbi:diguanylate cyclase (GGDEF)-like protein [Tahibacter aquaticus]|uniref:diguanylate cyclase n=1 Tax=Tahibacter aquaticus TaxID=520092 RepID=A0A4R6Z0V0_9GAMM|nr:diguanylate cyclase [Tahibacter aquaticus]TDR44999.1 diguanylate cyclase (GGDEF)-like protein [Tahibacter aquaticus]